MFGMFPLVSRPCKSATLLVILLINGASPYLWWPRWSYQDAMSALAPLLILVPVLVLALDVFRVLTRTGC